MEEPADQVLDAGQGPALINPAVRERATLQLPL